MSKKSFEEWWSEQECWTEDNNLSRRLVWNACASQYESEIEELKLKFSEATKTYTDDIDRLEKENEELKKKLDEADELIEDSKFRVNSKHCKKCVEFLKEENHEMNS